MTSLCLPIIVFWGGLKSFYLCILSTAPPIEHETTIAACCWGFLRKSRTRAPRTSSPTGHVTPGSGTAVTSEYNVMPVLSTSSSLRQRVSVTCRCIKPPKSKLTLCAPFCLHGTIVKVSALQFFQVYEVSINPKYQKKKKTHMYRKAWDDCFSRYCRGGKMKSGLIQKIFKY